MRIVEKLWMSRKAGPVPVVVVALVWTILLVGCGSEQPPSSPQSTGSPTLVAAGDIADCGSEGDEATAELLDTIEGTVVTLGDNVYRDEDQEDDSDEDDGDEDVGDKDEAEEDNGNEDEEDDANDTNMADAFDRCYEPTWGRHKDRTRPTPGNHDYDAAEAGAYFDYYGDAAGEAGKGYYSFDVGEWHIIALNSNCEEITGGCTAESPQVQWLESDLAANEDKSCTLALLHHPLFNSGRHGNTREVKPLWEVLYDGGADVVLSGHDHNYQRFAPQDPDGRADPERGIRQFVVGTGGKSHYEIKAPIANSEVYNDDTYGVLKLDLNQAGYDWQFVPVEGETFTDSGSDRCH